MNPQSSTVKNPLQPRQRGFTLVEMLTSAAILSIAVGALFFVVRKGSELERSAAHRMRAGIIIDSLFDSPGWNIFDRDSVRNDSIDVIIDPREGSGAGALRDTLLCTTTEINAGPIQVTRVIAYIVLDEPEGPDTVKMEKWIPR